ncbi:tyrosine/serine/threonine protein phosphatase, partial [Tilletia horrida]
SSSPTSDSQHQRHLYKGITPRLIDSRNGSLSGASTASFSSSSSSSGSSSSSSSTTASSLLAVSALPLDLSDSPKRRRVELPHVISPHHEQQSLFAYTSQGATGARTLCSPPFAAPPLSSSANQHSSPMSAQQEQQEQDQARGSAAPMPSTEVIPPTPVLDGDAAAFIQEGGDSTTGPIAMATRGLQTTSTRKARPKRLNLVPPPTSAHLTGSDAALNCEASGSDLAVLGSGTRSVPVSPSLVLVSSASSSAVSSAHGSGHGSGSGSGHGPSAGGAQHANAGGVGTAGLLGLGLGGPKSGGAGGSAVIDAVDPVKDLSSTLRGAPRRRPSMPFRASSSVSVSSSSAGGSGATAGPGTGGKARVPPSLSIQTDAYALGSEYRGGSAGLTAGLAVSGFEPVGAGAGPATAASASASVSAYPHTISSSSSQTSARIARVPEAYRDPSEHILSGRGSTLQHARSVYAAGPVEILPGLFLGDEHNARDAARLSELNITTILDVAKETTLPVNDVDEDEEETDASRRVGKGGFPPLAIPLRTPRQGSVGMGISMSGESATTPAPAPARTVPGVSTYRSPELELADAPGQSSASSSLATSSSSATLTPAALGTLLTPVTAYFTPPTTAYPQQIPDESEPQTPAAAAAVTPAVKNNAPPSALPEGEKTPYLRNTLSTPNLQRYGSSGRGASGSQSRNRLRDRDHDAPFDTDADERDEDAFSLSSESDSTETTTDTLMRMMDDDDAGTTTSLSSSSKPTSPEMTPEVSEPSSSASASASSARRKRATSAAKRREDKLGEDGEKEGRQNVETEDDDEGRNGDDDDDDDDNTLRLRDHRGKAVWLPQNAIALSIPPSPLSGRALQTRYIKLPWTHDEMGLASVGGGFTQGCAIIADALGIPPRLTPSGRVRRQTFDAAAAAGGVVRRRKSSRSRSGRRRRAGSASDGDEDGDGDGEEEGEAKDEDDAYVPRAPVSELDLDANADADEAAAAPSSRQRRRPAGVLVHCQCGVSRSATLVIAFVMQAAALMYGYEGLGSLTGMHDCYNLVKDKSASISPNCSLIYQLVEWERFLSVEAGKLRDAHARAAHKRSGSRSGGLHRLDAANVDAIAGVSSDADLSSLQQQHLEQPQYAAGGGGSSSGAPRGWSAEVMDEEEWSRMRLEEERKEAAEEEEALVRKARLEEAVQEARRRAAAAREGAAPSGAEGREGAGADATAVGGGGEVGDVGAAGAGAGPGTSPFGSGLGARRKKKAPPLTLGGAKLGGAGPAATRAAAANHDSNVPPTPSARTALESQSQAQIEPPLRTARMRPANLQIDPAASLTRAMPGLSLAPSAATDEEDGDNAQSSVPRALADDEQSGAESSRLKDMQTTPTSRRHPLHPGIAALPPSVSVPAAIHSARSKPASASSGGGGFSSHVRPQTANDAHVSPRTRSHQHSSSTTSFSSSSSSSRRPASDRRRSVQVMMGQPGVGVGTGMMTPPPLASFPPMMSSFVGAAYGSAAERKERHRRMFSSELPAALREHLVALSGKTAGTAGLAGAEGAAPSSTAVEGQSGATRQESG